MKKGFDSEKYVKVQSREILKRVKKFGRLYLEVGGKLCFDEHAARVLPGYKKTSKIEILKKLGSTSGHDSGEPDLDIAYCVNARELEVNSKVGLSGLTLKQKVLKDLKDISHFGFSNVKIIVTRFSGEVGARKFSRLLKRRKYEVHFHFEIDNYGKNLDDTFLGYLNNPYVRFGNDLVVVTGVAGGSGKMGFTLSQICFERRNKIKTGFAKLESFPVWNLGIRHPVNLAYEAATADLGDFNVIDKYHLKAYGKEAVNYNRDVDNFEILIGIMRRTGWNRWPFDYKSPTDMGINLIKRCIVDNAVCREAGAREIRRRFRGAKNKGKRIGVNDYERLRLEKIFEKI